MATWTSMVSNGWFAPPAWLRSQSILRAGICWLLAIARFTAGNCYLSAQPAKCSFSGVKAAQYGADVVSICAGQGPPGLEKIVSPWLPT